MTRKHYVPLAEIIGSTLAAAMKFGGGETRDEVYQSLYVPTCDLLARDNPNFDRHRFAYAVAQSEDGSKHSHSEKLNWDHPEEVFPRDH